MRTARPRTQPAWHAWGSGCGMRVQGTTTMRCIGGTTTSRQVNGTARRRAGTGRAIWQLLCSCAPFSNFRAGRCALHRPQHLHQAPAAAASVAELAMPATCLPACLLGDVGMYYGGEPVVWTDKPSLPQEARYEVLNKPPPVPASAAGSAAAAAGEARSSGARAAPAAALRQPAAAGTRPSAAGQQYAVAGSRITSSHPMSQVGCGRVEGRRAGTLPA